MVPCLYAVVSGLYIYWAWPDQPTPLQLVGVFMTVVAFGFWIVARIQLGNSFSIAPKATALVTNGLYSKFRHPVYYASVLAVVGLCLFSGSELMYGALVFLIVLELLRIRREEKLLQATFGQEYKRYKLSTWF